MKRDAQTAAVVISLISLAVTALSSGYTLLVISPAQFTQQQQIQQLESQQYNYTTQIIPVLPSSVELYVQEFKNPEPKFNITLEIIIETPHSGYLTVAQKGFQLTNASYFSSPIGLKEAFDPHSTVNLTGNYITPVTSGNPELTFHLIFESYISANQTWWNSHNLVGIVGYFGTVILEISFHDASLDSTITTVYPISLEINYEAV